MILIKNINKLIGNISIKKFQIKARYAVSIGALVLGGVSLQSCVDESLVDCPQGGVTVDDNQLYINIKVSMPMASGTRGETETGGDSSDGTWDAFTAENAFDYFTIFFFYPDSTTDSNGETVEGESYFSLQASNPKYDFTNNTVQTVSVLVEPEDLLKIAGKENVKVYIVANLDKPRYNPGNTETASLVDPFTAKIETLGKNSWLTFPKPVYDQALSNAEELKVDFRDLTSEMVEKYIGHQDMDNDAYALLVEEIKKTISGIFANERVTLERIYARFDYADGSENGRRLYPMTAEDMAPIDEDDDAETGEKVNICPFTLELMSMQPINISNYFNVFRHTSLGNNLRANYDETDVNVFNETVLFEKENGNGNYGKPTNSGSETEPNINWAYRWVMDADAKEKWNSVALPQTYQPRDDYYKNYVTYSTSGSGENIVYTVDEELTNEVITSIDLSNLAANAPGKDYRYSDEGLEFYPICYLGENTLPSTSTMVKSLSTGVAFKVKLGYMLNNVFVPLSLDNVEDYAAALKAVYGPEDPEEGEEEEQTPDGASEETPEFNITKSSMHNYRLKVNYVMEGNQPSEDIASITIITNEGEPDEEKVTIDPEDGEFFMTYYYFFQHNIRADHRQGIMDPMQFGIVRNNIYRLSVGGFNGLPDPNNPFDPDEPANTPAIAVNLKVLPWVKRSVSVTW